MRHISSVHRFGYEVDYMDAEFEESVNYVFAEILESRDDLEEYFARKYHDDLYGKEDA